MDSVLQKKSIRYQVNLASNRHMIQTRFITLKYKHISHHKLCALEPWYEQYFSSYRRYISSEYRVRSSSLVGTLISIKMELGWFSATQGDFHTQVTFLTQNKIL